MKRIRFGTNFAIFVLFFGITVLEAIRKQNVWEIILWALGAVIFLAADMRKQ